MAGQLHGRKVAVLATDGVEQVELLEPAEALKQSGAQVEIVSNKAKEIQGFNHIEKGHKIRVDRILGEAKPNDYDALMLHAAPRSEGN
jgi:protease I